MKGKVDWLDELSDLQLMRVRAKVNYPRIITATSKLKPYSNSICPTGLPW